VSEPHDTVGLSPASFVDVIHRIRSDPGRLSRAWFESVRAAGLDDVAYVELVAGVTMVTGVAYFCRSLAMPPSPSPDPLPGEPTRSRPAGAKPGTAWVAMLA